MDENDKDIITEDGKTEDQDFNLLNEVKELRENSVSKKDYEALQQKYKAMVKEFVNGGGSTEAKETVDIEKLRNELFGEDVEKLSNRDFWKKTLQLRHERMEKDGVDIFLPKGNKTRYTAQDIETANRVDEVISQMLEDSEDNPELFNVLFNRALN